MELVLVILALISSVALALAYVSIFVHLRHSKRMQSAADRNKSLTFGISVLKPLKGVDEGLLENLRAIARQDHPQFEVLFGAEDPNDPALEVAGQVVREFPQCELRVVGGAFETGLNPKVRVLRQLSTLAKHEWLLISDSNVRPAPGYLRALTYQQQIHDADLVHSMLAGAGGQTLGGRLEELQLNGWVSASIALSNSCGHGCVIGKSMLMRSAALSSVGGLASVADILAEDYILGAKFQSAGKKVVLSPHLLAVITARSSCAQFFNRHVRWGQMRRRIAPGIYAAELLANPTPFFLALIILDPTWSFTWAVAQLSKWMCDAFVYARLSPSPSLRTLSLMPIKDVLMPVIWLLGGLRRTINWRGQRLLVGVGSRLYPLADPQPLPKQDSSWLPNPS